MFKKRLKGLLAMLLAGSIALSALPMSASATISDSNVSVYDGDDTKVVDYSVSETLSLPVKNALLRQETDSSGDDRYISVSKDSESLLDEEDEEKYYFYLCYYDGGQESFKISSSAMKTEKDVWNEINTWVTEDPTLGTNNLFLCRKVTVNVYGNGADSEFSTTELLDYLIVNQGNYTTNQALHALFTAKPNSIWEVNPRFTKNPPFYIYQKDAATSISDFLLEYPHEKRLNLFEQSSIRVTALDPKTNGEIGWGSFIESKLLDENGEPRKISDHFNDLFRAVPPEAGKKYDTDGWQLWAGVTSCGGLYDFSKVELDKKPDSIGVTELNKMQNSITFVYFPQVESAPSLEVTAPLVGKTPSTECKILDKLGGYSVNGVVEWACGNNPLSENDEFKAGKKYTVSVVLQPDIGLQFVETTKVKINGNDATTTLSPIDGTLKASYTFEVTKATPYIKTAPTATAITYGEALSASTLKNAAVWYSESDQKEVEGTFTWKEAATKPTVADSDKTKYDVVFTPTDAKNYNTVETKITLTVNKAASAPGLPNNNMKVDYGKKKVSDITTLPEGWAWQDEDKALTVGTAVKATAVYTGADKGNYETERVEISITRAECTHATTEVKNAKDATCTEKGYTGDTYRKDCGAKLASGKEIEMTAHKWDAGKVTKEPTLAAEGVKTYTCSVCGKTKTEAIPKKEATTQEPPKKGDVVKDDKTSVKVEVSDVKKKEVEYKEPDGKKAKTVSIPATVKIDGVTYKVTKVDDNAFKNNKTVTEVTVGSNIETIGKNAFYKCTKLKTVKIGKNVTKIGANAFKGCKKLKTIKITSTKLTSKTVSKNAFKGITKATTIKVPKKKLSAYKKLFKQKGLSSKVKVKGY